MARYLEKETDVEVDIKMLPPFRGHAHVAQVTYPNGRVYGLGADLIETYFTIITPQTIELCAVSGLDYER